MYHFNEIKNILEILILMHNLNKKDKINGIIIISKNKMLEKEI